MELLESFRSLGIEIHNAFGVTEAPLITLSRLGENELGSVGALVMGAGMSLVMTDLSTKISIASPMPIGIAMGVVGLAVAIVNYPIYKSILGKRRQKYADKIIALSDKIMKG